MYLNPLPKLDLCEIMHCIGGLLYRGPLVALNTWTSTEPVMQHTRCDQVHMVDTEAGISPDV